MASGLSRSLIISDLFGVIFVDEFKAFMKENQTKLENYVKSPQAPKLAKTLGFPAYYHAITTESEVIGISSNEQYYGELERASGVPAKEIEQRFNDTNVVIKSTVRLYQKLHSQGYHFGLLTSTSSRFAQKFIDTEIDGKKIRNVFDHLITIPELAKQLGEHDLKKGSTPVLEALINTFGISDKSKIIIIDDSKEAIDFFSSQGFQAIYMKTPDFDLEKALYKIINKPIIISDLFGVIFVDKYREFLSENKVKLQEYLDRPEAPKEAKKLGFPAYYNCITQGSESTNPSSDRLYYKELEKASGIPAKEIEEKFHDKTAVIKNAVHLYRKLNSEGYRLGLLTNTCRDFAMEYLDQELDGEEIGNIFDQVITMPELSAKLGSREGLKKASRPVLEFIKEIFSVSDAGQIMIVDDSKEVIDFFANQGAQTIYMETPEFDLESSMFRLLESETENKPSVCQPE